MGAPKQILDADGKRNDGRRSTFTNRGPGSCLPKRTDSVCTWRQAFLMTDIQALVLGIRKECSWRKLAAGDTTVGSTPCCWVVFLSAADRPELDKCGNLLNRITPDRENSPDLEPR